MGTRFALEDLDRLAELGVRTCGIRCFGNERRLTAFDNIQWAWADERLNRLRQLRIRPIVGLLHHGSGPRYTSLLDPHFPEKLAKYATAVARRYPWVRALHSCKRTTNHCPVQLSLWSLVSARPRAAPIRESTADAMPRDDPFDASDSRGESRMRFLIQTEDLGKTFSTQTLAYQAEFENERRWLTFDLLCGKVVPKTAMWDYFRWLGIDAEGVGMVHSEQTPPDVLGINHYITSERFLDERLTRYPGSIHGGNGRHFYADVEAVRVCSEGIAGPKAILKEVWERYHLPDCNYGSTPGVHSRRANALAQGNVGRRGSH